tara:strand:- start:74 stop:400 length:327 start_codon:yes stop_codon:yes gene_type:complete
MIYIHETDYLQAALKTFNTDTPNWYIWKKTDSDGNKIPNDQRMTWENIVVCEEGATIPSEADVNAKIEEIKDAETAAATEKVNKKASAKTKLKNLGLDDAEIKAILGL